MNSAVMDPYSIPLERLDPGQAELFRSGQHLAWFARLRREDPVHFVNSEEFGPYWSITRFNDIQYVDSHHELFSSEPSIVIGDPEPEFTLPMFIAMDPPKHDQERAVVAPAVVPKQLAEWEGLIRTRVQGVLDGLPVGETFDWVERVSIELTTMMLATLFDFPFEERHLLTYWSGVATTGPAVGNKDVSMKYRQAELLKCLEYFTRLREERAQQPPKMDFVSLLAHGQATRDMPPLEFLGNLVLLIVGGNDTTRNSMSGSVCALNRHPAEFAKLRSNHGLIPGMVSEVIRWQTPLAHMRRIATQDVELGGKLIKQGDKVVMWYVSGNRDETVIEQPDEFIIDRANPRHHISFGFGIHRCMGNRLAEMQLRILWEEMLARFSDVQMVGEPVRTESNFVMGYDHLPVRLVAR